MVLERLRRRRRREKVGSILTVETILFELSGFLDSHYAESREGTLLDLGAGTAPYRPLYERYFASCVATDVAHSLHDTSSVEVLASAEALPFEDESFDAVVCTEVLEHCRDPRAAMGEISRVLRPAGRAFITTPFLVPLHEMPHDYYRYTPSALVDLAETAGLSVTSLVSRGDYVALALGVLAYPISKLFQRLSRITGLKLHHPANPVVYLVQVAPQRLYFAAWREVRTGRSSLLRSIHEKLSHFALGYVLVVQRSLTSDER
jgi:SAM-dependent methyltransferase